MKQIQTRIQNSGGNPYLNSLQFKSEVPSALKLLNKYFTTIKQVGRKYIYLVNENTSTPFYIWLTSAPSNTKFDSVIDSIMRKNGKYPIYVFFTRDVKTYPTTAGKTYWNQLKSVYKKSPRKFKGAIMGVGEFTIDMANKMITGTKIDLNFNRYMQIVDGVGVTMEDLLKEIGELTSKKAELIKALSVQFNIK